MPQQIYLTDMLLKTIFQCLLQEVLCFVQSCSWFKKCKNVKYQNISKYSQNIKLHVEHW